jgi:hypothetical protein
MHLGMVDGFRVCFGDLRYGGGVIFEVPDFFGDLLVFDFVGKGVNVGVIRRLEEDYVFSYSLGFIGLGVEGLNKYFSCKNIGVSYKDAIYSDVYIHLFYEYFVSVFQNFLYYCYYHSLLPYDFFVGKFKNVLVSIDKQVYSFPQLKSGVFVFDFLKDFVVDEVDDEVLGEEEDVSQYFEVVSDLGGVN